MADCSSPVQSHTAVLKVHQGAQSKEIEIIYCIISQKSIFEKA